MFGGQTVLVWMMLVSVMSKILSDLRILSGGTTEHAM